MEITSSVVKNCSALVLCLRPVVRKNPKNPSSLLLLKGKMITGYNFGDAFGHVCAFRGCWTEKCGDLDVHLILLWCGETQTHFAFSHPHLVIFWDFFSLSEPRSISLPACFEPCEETGITRRGTLSPAVPFLWCILLPVFSTHFEIKWFVKT